MNIYTHKHEYIHPKTNYWSMNEAEKNNYVNANSLSV